MLCGPVASGVVGVKLQSPAALDVVVPISWPLSKKLIVRFGPAVPTTVGVVSSVTPLFWIGPCTLPTLSSMRVMAGATGPLASTMIGYGALGALGFSAASVATAVRLRGPLSSGDRRVSDQLPCGSAVVVPMGPPLSYTRHAGAGFGRALDLRQGVVGGAVFRHAAGQRADIVDHVGDGRRGRRHGVDAVDELGRRARAVAVGIDRDDFRVDGAVRIGREVGARHSRR